MVANFAQQPDVEHPARPTTRMLRLDPDARRLRESLRRLRDVLASLDLASAGRVRMLAAHVIARSSDTRRERRGPIFFAIYVLSEAVRVEVSGPGLPMPTQRDSVVSIDWLCPEWTLEGGLADRWGVDRDGRGPAVWFEVDHPAS
jgi:hypothetical protein